MKLTNISLKERDEFN